MSPVYNFHTPRVLHFWSGSLNFRVGKWPCITCKRLECKIGVTQIVYFPFNQIRYLSKFSLLKLDPINQCKICFASSSLKTDYIRVALSFYNIFNSFSFFTITFERSSKEISQTTVGSPNAPSSVHRNLWQIFWTFFCFLTFS